MQSPDGTVRREPTARMTHPLAGADLITLVSSLWHSGGVRRSDLGRAAGAFAAALGRSPFSLLERAWTALMVPKRLDPPPIFIVGHWRSGTTHLYNILARGNFAYVPPIATGIPWDMLLIGGLFRPLLERTLPTSRAIDNVPVTPSSPQEDEIGIASMTRHSFYHALYFPSRFDELLRAGLFFQGCSEAEIREWQRSARQFHAKLAYAQAGRRLLVKNPVYTGRVKMLAAMYPGAQFIGMTRNPYEIFVSMRNFYQKLLPQFALQDYDDVDIDRAVLEVYPRLMEQLAADVAELPPGNYVQLDFDELEARPLAAVERIYATLGLDGFEAARPAFERYLASVSSYEKNRFGFPPEVLELVDRNWGRYVAASSGSPPA